MLGTNVKRTSPSELKNKRGAVRFIKSIDNARPKIRAQSPMPSPASWRLTKNNGVPNVSRAYTELDEYTNKHPIRMSVAIMIRNTCRSAYKGNFFEIIVLYVFVYNVSLIL